MKANALLISTLLLAQVSVASAHEDHDPGTPGKLVGTVHFPISCSEASQKKFEAAVALLHSFWYPQAEKEFRAIADAEPSCGIAFWGVAMSYYHPLWNPPPDAPILAKGLVAVAEARKRGDKKSQREKGYIEAIASFYEGYDKRDHRARAVSYEQAMEKLYKQFPDDAEAGIFYALALNGTAPLTDHTYANQKKAGAILDELFLEQPNHPGIAHYIIHSYDYPSLAKQALNAARRYAKIAPDVAHAQHMPSHIFTRFGYWDESINANLGSAKAARSTSLFYELLHSLDYLEYAYLQKGMDKKAAEVMQEMNVMTANPELFQAAFSFAAVPARYALERRHWADATKLIPRASYPWPRFEAALISHYEARGLGFARSGKPAEAIKEAKALEALQGRIKENKTFPSYWVEQCELAHKVVLAWIARAEKRDAEALQLMRKAVELEETYEKPAVTPGPLIPARELLGDMLLELKQPAEAQKEFATSLIGSPNRFFGVAGAARAAEQAGDVKQACKYYQQLLELTKDGDGKRDELAQARAYLKKHPETP